VKLVKIVLKNLFRHRLRTILTMLGIATAVMAFGLIRTIVGAWNAGVAAAAANRMITRQSVSFIFPLPLPYRQQIARVPGVTAVSWANWFGGVYGDPNDFKNFWPRLAVDAETFYDLYPEYQVPPDQLAQFRKERNACIIGRKLAAQHGFKIGDVITMEGDIFPGRWEWVVRGSTRAGTRPWTRPKCSSSGTTCTSRCGHGSQVAPWRPVGSSCEWNHRRDAARRDRRRRAVREFARADQDRDREGVPAGFVAMSSAIITSLQVISVVIVGIILLVLANTIVMAVRERTREYAVLKTLGFTARHLIALIFGESLLIALCGGLLGLALTFPMVAGFGKALPTFFPIINVAPLTIGLALGAALIAGAVAALFPATRVVRTPIVTGLRMVG